MPTLYILAGCNGAGKTTAAQILLPEIFHCDEFVNADLIAKGISPFNPESVALLSARMMLKRMDTLVSKNCSFVIETTLATKSYVSFIKEIKEQGYNVVILFLWLNSFELAIGRVEKRVAMGGHNIPIDVIERRYKSGIKNFIKLYLPICNSWSAYDNSFIYPNPIAEGILDVEKNIINFELWNQLNHIASQ
jgi:predicted ABC-type ATPase